MRNSLLVVVVASLVACSEGASEPGAAGSSGSAGASGSQGASAATCPALFAPRGFARPLHRLFTVI